MIIILHGRMHISPTRRVRSVGVTPRPQDYQKNASPKIKLEALPNKRLSGPEYKQAQPKIHFWARWRNFLAKNYIFVPNYQAQKCIFRPARYKNVFLFQSGLKMSSWASSAQKHLFGSDPNICQQILEIYIHTVILQRVHLFFLFQFTYS